MIEILATATAAQNQARDRLASDMASEAAATALANAGLAADQVDLITTLCLSPSHIAVRPGLIGPRLILQDLPAMPDLATLPLHDSLRTGLVRPGQTVMFAGLGAGWAYAAQIWRLETIAIEHDDVGEAEGSLPLVQGIDG